MVIRHARSWAVASLLLSAALTTGCQTKDPDGITWASYGADATGIEIFRQQPADLAQTICKNPHALQWPTLVEGSIPTTQPVALASAAPAVSENSKQSLPVDDQLANRDLVKPPKPQDAPSTDSVATTAGSTTPPAADATTSPASTQPAALAPEIERLHGPSLATNQKLTVDLVTGKTSFLDTDGRLYPMTTKPEDLEFFRSVVNTTDWRNGQLWTKEDTTVGSQYIYTANGLAGKNPLQHYVQWLAPSSKPLPDTIKTFHEIFELQQRKIHPLSETVNLLK